MNDMDYGIKVAEIAIKMGVTIEELKKHGSTAKEIVEAYEKGELKLLNE